MISKKELLKNLRNYTPEKIAEAIKAGVISLDELSNDSEDTFPPLLKEQIEKVLTTRAVFDKANNDFEVVQHTPKKVSYRSYKDLDEMVDNKGMFKRPFNFITGRIRRKEYWLSLPIYMGLIMIAAMISKAFAISENGFLFLCIPGWLFLWAQGSKRCHDRGNAGWYQFIPFYIFWMLFADGEPYDNDYGNDPKGRNII